MAEKRMFSKKIIDTDWFMDMPSSSQNLYFHLSMRADDDGFVSSPNRIIKMVGASNDDYRLLITKRFIIPFDSGICVIKDWRINNYLRADRHTDTIYQEEKDMLSINENGEYQLGIPSGIPKVDPVYTKSNSISNSNINNNIEKDSIIQRDNINNISRDSELNEMHYQDENLSEETTAHSKTSKEPKHKYGVYKNILLTDRELEKLKEEFPNWQEVIDYVDEAIEMKGYKYKSHYLAIRKWFKDKSRANSLGSGLNKKVKDTSTIDENGVISL